MQDALYIVLEYVTGGAIMDYDQEERKYGCLYTFPSHVHMSIIIICAYRY
jgi:hypothetical protein